MGGLQRLALFVALAGVVGACTPFCGPGASKFTLLAGHVDPVYICPIPSEHRSYDIHGTVAADNPTSSSVSISSVSTVMTVAARTSDWNNKVGDTYETRDITFSPRAIAAHSAATLKFTIPGWCTDLEHAGRTDTHADYSVRVTVTTSAGTFKLDTANKHRLVTP